MHPSSHADLGPLGAGSDAARRIHDAVTLHLTVSADNAGRWLAFRLEDGQCDSTLYDSKNDAMRAKSLFASLYGYLHIMPTGCSVAEAESYLRTCRMVASNPNVRWRNADYDAPSALTETMVLPMRKEHLR